MAVRSRVIDALLGITCSEQQWLSQSSCVPYLEYPTRDRKATRVEPLYRIRLPRITLSLVSASLGQKGEPSRASASNTATTDKAIVSQYLTWNTLLGITMPYLVQLIIPSRTQDKTLLGSLYNFFRLGDEFFSTPKRKKNSRKRILFCLKQARLREVENFPVRGKNL